MESIVPCCVMGAGLVVASYGSPSWLVVAALGISYCAFMALQGPALSVPTQFLAGRAAAAGIAAMNTITMFSGFIGPYWMGVMKDRTGSYWLGLRGLVVPSLVAAAVMFALTRSLARRTAPVATAGMASETV